MRKYLIPAAALLSLAALPTLSAASEEAGGDRLSVPRDQWLPISDVAEKLTAQGYTVTEIETEDDAYEVEMVDKNGVHSEARVHPASGEILPHTDDD